MSQDNLSIRTVSPPALSGVELVTAINAGLQALASLQSGATEPGATYPYQYWLDTANNLLKQRNGANSAWVTVAFFDGTNFVPYHKGSAIPDIGALGGSLLSTATAIAAHNLIHANGADVASAATLDLDAATGDTVTVTGTTTITAITLAAGRERRVRFAGSLTLTHGASLVLPGGASLTTAAGDIFVFRGYSGGVVRCVGYQLATGRPIGGITSALLPAGTIVDRAYAEYTANADLSVAIPADDSIPSSSEGTQILSVSITPKSATNRVRLRFQAFGTCGVSRYLIAALFENGGSSAIAASASSMDAADRTDAMVLEHEKVPGVTTTQTYAIRVGAHIGTLRLNGTTSGRLFGGVARATLIAEEIAA